MPEPRLLWTPSPRSAGQSNMTAYMNWLHEHKKLQFRRYDDLWQWSIDKPEDFWGSLVEYFDVIFDGAAIPVVSGSMPGAKWFENLKLNYAEHVFRDKDPQAIAILYQSENTGLQEIRWSALREQVSGFQKFLLDAGVKEGDTVAAFLPSIPEATVAFLAACSLGAIWSSCSPDFGIQSVIDRFAQIRPKVLIATNRYHYNGKSFDKTDVVSEVVRSLPTVEKVVIVGDGEKNLSSIQIGWQEALQAPGHTLQFNRVPFNHPIWVLYSSGTTGLPKAITHSQGGILIEQLKYLSFHNDVKKGERFLWYTTTGWMMWNYLQGTLLAGATMVLYDGSPAYPDLKVLWGLIQDAKVNHFGTSAGFLLACLKEGLKPGKAFDLSSLRSVSSTGSTLPPEGFDWVYSEVKKDVWLASMSGGTDVCSAFVGGHPSLPVYAGEIQCRSLGCSLEAFNENGKPVQNEVGEMVITKPMPSMPVFFWNDQNFRRYRESYFEMYPGIWRHGDWIELTSRNGVIIYGRSDATLNRGGVRIGTSEIYRAVDKVKEVKDSLIICLEREKGEFYMPLFVMMGEGMTLTDEVRKKINNAIRQDNSPRHVPDEIIEVPDIPYTISGKKTETPVKKVLMGKNPHEVVNSGSLRNPVSIEFFVQLYKRTLEKT